MNDVNVVTLGGHPLVKEGQPYNNVVDMLCELLIEAQKGEIKAFAFATVSPKSGIAHGWTLNEGTNLDTVAAVSRLQCNLHHFIFSHS